MGGPAFLVALRAVDRLTKPIDIASTATLWASLGLIPLGGLFVGSVRPVDSPRILRDHVHNGPRCPSRQTDIPSALF